MRPSPPIWYVGKRKYWSGPYDVDTIVRMVLNGELSWSDYAWKSDATAKWIRLSDHDAFQAFLPERPPLEFFRDIKERDFPNWEVPAGSMDLVTRKGSELALSWEGSADIELERGRDPSLLKKGIWFLQFDGSEFGPLTLPEVEVILTGDKLKGNLFAWREGMEEWRAVSEVNELQPFLKQVGMLEITEGQRRKHQRVPLVAMVRFGASPIADSAEKGAVPRAIPGFVGVCRDISLRGMLVYCNQSPGAPGTILHLEVTPVGDAAALPFVVDAEVIRTLAGKKGFSVKFLMLNPRTSAAIERHVKRLKSG